jgi:hypothetical protein
MERQAEVVETLVTPRFGADGVGERVGELSNLLAMLAPVAALEKDFGGVDRLLGRHHRGEPAEASERSGRWRLALLAMAVRSQR